MIMSLLRKAVKLRRKNNYGLFLKLSDWKILAGESERK